MNALQLRLQDTLQCHITKLVNIFLCNYAKRTSSEALSKFFFQKNQLNNKRNNERLLLRPISATWFQLLFLATIYYTARIIQLNCVCRRCLRPPLLDAWKRISSSAALFLNIIIIIISNSSSSIKATHHQRQSYSICATHSRSDTLASQCIYLGVFFVSGRVFKCSFDHYKCQFFTACNAIFSKVERFASEAVLLILIRTKCLPRCWIVPTGYKRRKVVGVHSYSLAYEIV